MTAQALEALIQEGIKGLPPENLAEIADFIYFVRKRVLRPEAFAEELRELALRAELKQLSRAEEAHLETESDNYEQRFPANEWVADTVALILRLEGRTLDAAATAAFDLAEAGGGVVHIPGMVFAEIIYLAQKGRIAVGLTEVASYLGRFPNGKEFPLTFTIVEAANRIDDIPELHDRLIAGTALLLGVPLLTCDATIQASRWIHSAW